MKPYRVFDHTADLGIEVYGRTLPELYAHAAYAVYDLMADLDAVRPETLRKISVEGADREDLLVNYLREVLHLFYGEKLLLKSFSIDAIDERSLAGTVKGEAFDRERHRLKREIKAVTYHRTEVRETPGGWRARVILDV